MTISKEKEAIQQTRSRLDAIRETSSMPMTAFLAFQMILGFEWFWSGIAKFIMPGGFPASLPGELGEIIENAPAWYANLLSGFVLPQAILFGYVIEIAELLIGIAFLFGPLIWFFVWNRTPDLIKSALFSLTAAAAIGGFFMAANFHFAMGYAHPWLLPTSGLDESVDFDSMVAAMQILIAVINILALGYLRKAAPALARTASSAKQEPGLPEYR